MQIDKMPGSRPVVVGKVLRGICSTTIMSVMKKDHGVVIQDSNVVWSNIHGSEAAIHVICEFLEEEESEGVHHLS